MTTLDPISAPRIEAEDAQRLREKLATTGPLKSGEVDAALREAREIRARYEPIPRAETIAAVLEATDGHPGRIYKEQPAPAAGTRRPRP